MSEAPTNDRRLKREIGFLPAVFLIVANMVGTGIFTTSGFIMEELGDPILLLGCWLAGGLFALAGALSYGRLGVLFPRAGGEYVYLRESFGPLPAFLSGWISLIVGFSAPIAASAVAFSKYFMQFAPLNPGEGFALSLGGMRLISLAPSHVLAVGAIAVLSLAHCYSLRFGVGVQNSLTIFKVILLMAFVASGLWISAGAPTSFLRAAPDAPGWFSSKFAASMVFVSFSYSGWNAAAYVGAEIINPRKNLPLSLMAGALLVMVMYVLLNTVYLLTLGVEDMRGVVEVGAKSAEALFGGRVGGAFSLAVSICLLSNTGAMILTGPRVYYAMAQDGLFFNLFARVSARNIPVYAVTLQALIAIVMVITVSFENLLFYIGYTLSLFSCLTVVGLFVLRIRQPGRFRGARFFGYPFTPLFFIIGSLWVMIYSLPNKPAAIILSLCTIAGGLLVYWYFGGSRRESKDKRTTRS